MKKKYNFKVKLKACDTYYKKQNIRERINN